MNLRLFILCADDYGIAPGVCDGIEELIERRVLTCTSAMSLMPTWAERACGLMRGAAAVGAEVGLHLTLTDQRPLTAMPRLCPQGRLPSVGRLLALALRGALAPETAYGVEIKGEIDAQWAAFVAAAGRLPDYIDGHQHAHMLPGIRHSVLATVMAALAAQPTRELRPWIRSCGDALPCLLRRPAAGKALLLHGLNQGMEALCQRHGLRYNQGFSGLHDFSGRPPFAELFPQFLQHHRPFPLVHVHPGIVDAPLRACDSLTTPREAEHAYLRSASFVADCQRLGWAPAPPSAVFAALHTP